MPLFAVIPGSVGIISGNYAISSTPTVITTREAIEAYLATGVNVPANAPVLWQGDAGPSPFNGVYELQFLPSRTRIILDPFGVATLIDPMDPNFPKGMIVSQFNYWVDGPMDIQGSNKTLTILNWLFRNQIVSTTIQGTNPTAWPSYPNLVPPASTIDFFGPNAIQPQWALSKLLGSPMAIQATIAAGGGGGVPGPNLQFGRWLLYGVYNVLRYSFALNTPNANPGDVITITDANNHLNDFTSFKAYWKSNPNATEFSGGVDLPIITSSPGVVTLMLPLNKGLPYGGRRLRIVGIMDSGNGEVDIADVNVVALLTDGSGIYNLTPGKREDTYYDRSVTPSVTVDMKMPKPFIKTGFF